MSNARQFIEAMIKQLPPSASRLHLLDIEGTASELLRQMRDDLDVAIASVDARTWTLTLPKVDAVVACGGFFEKQLLIDALSVLRSGGRLIIIDPLARPSKDHVNALEALGYTRILVEYALDNPKQGVLIRGEKPHTTHDTFARIQQIANVDHNTFDFQNYRGHYLHLLIQQIPNKPLWRLEPDERIIWKALALDNDASSILLAFSSLPKAVAFMQPAVVQGLIRDVNKVAKFTRKSAQVWTHNVLVNPPLDTLHSGRTTWIDIDLTIAEMPDE